MLDAIHIEAGESYHPMCDPQVVFDARNAELKGMIMEMIDWTDNNAARSLQVEIGPSEIGHPCDQFIGRVLAGSRQINFRPDPWPKLVGTAIHQWLEKSVNDYKDEVLDDRFRKWRTEMEMPVDDMIKAHSDLYTGEDVVDYKTLNGIDDIKSLQRHGLPDHAPDRPHHYRVQLQTYGLAHERAGRPVRDVVLVFLPRGGRIRDLWIYREPYDRRIGIAALKRVYDVGNLMIRLGVDQDPSMWAQVPMTPGSQCWVCPYNSSKLSSDHGPDATGCPGTNGTAEEMKSASDKFFDGYKTSK